MSATASRKRAKRGRVSFQSEEELWTLVLGDRHRQKIQDLVSVLEKYFARVEVSPNPLLSGGLSSYQNPAMVVVTDVMKTGPDTILEMRRELPKAGFIALFDRLPPDMEKSLRCAGTLFLGSFETFFAFSQTIVRPLLARRRE